VDLTTCVSAQDKEAAEERIKYLIEKYPNALPAPATVRALAIASI